MFSRRSDTDVAKVDAKGGRGGGRGAARASTSPARLLLRRRKRSRQNCSRIAPSRCTLPLLSHSLVGTPTFALRPSPL